MIYNGEYIPVDFKTTSSDPRGQAVFEAYQNQIDEYVFLLRENKKPITGYGYLIFFYPDLAKEVHRGFPMITKIERVEARPDKVLSRIEKAIEILKKPMPQSAEDCPFCCWFKEVKSYMIPD